MIEDREERLEDIINREILRQMDLLGKTTEFEQLLGPLQGGRWYFEDAARGAGAL